MPSNDASEEDNSFDVIPSFLDGSPFKILPDEKKLAILKKGRPLPNLNILKRDISRNCNRTFQSSWYSIHNWLCGSKTYNKLFCWPCLLMRPETSSWCSTGNDDMKRFTSIATKHTICKSHLKAISEYDTTLTGFGLAPEFADELNFKCKEENMSDQTDGEDEVAKLYFKEGMKNKKKVTETYTSEMNSNSTNIVEMKESHNLPKLTKITFKTWQEMNKDTFPISSSKFFEDSKLYKWKRKVARQELKNARLMGEKIKCEIEVLKVKMEYYKSLSEAAKMEEGLERSSITATNEAVDKNLGK